MKANLLKRPALALVMGLSVLGLAGCESGTGSVNGSVGVYYDSMLWNDYYYGGSRPPYRPVPPGRPDRPDRPDRPPVGVTPPIGVLPPGGRPPVARPPIARPPIHRPAGGGGRFR